MRWLAFLVVFFGYISNTRVPPKIQTTEAFINSLRKQTVQVVVHCAGEKFATGSGVLLGGSLVATANHVVPPNCNPSVRGKSASTKVRDPAADIAILEVVGLSAPMVHYGSHYLGQQVICVGWATQFYTGKTSEQVSRGELIIEYPGSKPRFRVGCSFQKGSSGGPIFDNTGHLVGLTTAMMEPLPDVPLVDHFIASPAYVVQRLHQKYIYGE